MRSRTSPILALSVLAAAIVFVGAAPVAPAFAKSRPAKEKPEPDKPAGGEDGAEVDKKGAKQQKGAKGAGGKPELLGSSGDWGAYAAKGRDKTCYALAQPNERQPKAKLKDTSAYVFISTRPGDHVKNEVAINLGYPTKDNGAATAEIDGEDYELITKGTNAWLKNPEKEKEFVEALKNGAKLVVKASSAKGTATTDTYSLKGLSDTLAKVASECR